MVIDLQLTYIFNMVLILKLLYITQINPLTDKECNSFIFSLSSNIKHKLSLFRLVDMCIPKHHSFYNIQNLHVRMVQDASLYIINIINMDQECELLHFIFKIHLFQLQSNLLLSKFLFEEQDLRNMVLYHSYYFKSHKEC